jgi:hypothetical protein
MLMTYSSGNCEYAYSKLKSTDPLLFMNFNENENNFV